MLKDKFVAKTATEGLKILWSKDFFKIWKKITEIEKKFSDNDHHFTDAELGMALKRCRYLTRRGKRRHYEYIQKHPFVPEVVNEKRKRNR